MYRGFVGLPLIAVLAGCAPPRPVPLAVPTEHPLVTYRHRPMAASEPARTPTGRYSFVANGPEPAQVDPLLALIDVHLPPDLRTVEEAADYLLKRSGYCLRAPESPEARHLLRQPLPDVHRHLGPMTLRDALLTLGGRAFQLVVDEVYREVGYRIPLAGGSA
jgi:conjugative transfer region protein (TIGR03748 family)